MAQDISEILGGWEFHPDRINVRIVAGDDGREKIQMRLDMGLLQMNLDGRPDGQRPEGRDSWLDFYRACQQAHDEANLDGKPFVLESADCSQLLREGMQYYHRYLSFWHLGRYELCARDTNRNLRLFAFVREHARHEQDKLQFDQWRPYVLMMHSRAVATPLVNLGDTAAAIRAIDAGIQGIKAFLLEYEQLHRAGQCGELLHLERWREELAAKIPRLTAEPSVSSSAAAGSAEGIGALQAGASDPLAELREELKTAIAEERFEDAAALRDRIARLDMPQR